MRIRIDFVEVWVFEVVIPFSGKGITEGLHLIEVVFVTHSSQIGLGISEHQLLILDGFEASRLGLDSTRSALMEVAHI